MKVRFSRKSTNHSLAIEDYVARHAGCSTSDITCHIFNCRSDVIATSFLSLVKQDLYALRKYGVLCFQDGWHVSPTKDPFTRLALELESSAAIDAFGDLSLMYSGTGDMRIVNALKLLISGATCAADHRRIAYINLLQVIGVPSSKWPQKLHEFVVPADLDWIERELGRVCRKV